MISYNFQYYQPTTTKEATNLFQSLLQENKSPIYFAGGTEVITLGRMNKIVTDAVIDINNISACHSLEQDDTWLTLGAALTLTSIKEMKKFPLLEKVVSEIADRTSRNKITLGGNICANIIYREAVLPFLLTKSYAVIATKHGLKERPFHELFDQTLQLREEEFLVQIKVATKDLTLPFFTVKKRRQWGVDYPLLTIAAILKETHIHTAYSGLYAYPFHCEKVDAQLNKPNTEQTKRIERALQAFHKEILHDIHGSDTYRKFVLKNVLTDVIDTLKKG